MKHVNKILACSGLCLISQLTWAGLVVIVSADSPVSNLSATQASDIFLSKTNTFPDGSAAEAIDQNEDNSDREKFYELVAGKNSRQLKSYWSKLMFSGKGKPPKEAGGAGDVVNKVASGSGFIGYADSSQVNASVKVVLEAE